MLEIFYWVIIIVLIMLFFVSLISFISRVLRNSSVRTHETVQNGKHLKLIIEQNEKIISLLEKDKEV